MFTLITLPFKSARIFVRVAGIRGVLLLAVGVAIGMLIAPTSGARLRAKLKAKVEAATAGGATDYDPVV